MANVTHHVHVYEADGEYRVYPALLKTDGNSGANADKVVFHNNTSEDLVFCFPPKSFHNTDPSFFGVNAQGKSNAQQVKSQGGSNSELFTFQAMAYKSGKKAKGNSDPVLIVEN